MEILVFQISIFLIIVFAGYKGKIYLNLISTLIILFTITMVNTDKLMIIQFITIVLSYLFTLNKIEANKNTTKTTFYSKPLRKSKLEIILRILINLVCITGISFGCFRYSLFIFSNIEEVGFFLFSLISYLLILIISFLIIFYLLSRCQSLIKEL